ncbi:MAG: ADP-glyceromanno-heptose 6-epimerase [Deltaproteobacteria bacterium]|nr:ADP-glyceromanno-heptose 6-epimerase [Deltaproteobacteria bacterium]
MYIVTGGAGFIGSALVWHLNQLGIEDVLIVDNLATSEKWRNLVPLRYRDYIHKSQFLEQLQAGHFTAVKAIVHLGACSATTQRDVNYLMENNYRYSVSVAQWAIANNTRFIYASSAATYGNGSCGFSDDDTNSRKLAPINAYGYSKQLFDLWALRNGLAERMAGIKFFNVFGPNEYHKDDMRSVVHKAYGQIKSTGTVRLFKSHHPDYPDGGQLRDFVYVKDCVQIIGELITKPDVCGIFNLGTGVARSWNDLVSATFAALNLPIKIHYTDMPADIREQYQYYTKAPMTKLSKALGREMVFPSLEQSIENYVQHYLENGQKCLS